MKEITFNEAVKKCEELQKRIKRDEINNVDESTIIKLRKEYDFYFKIVLKGEEKND